MVRIRTLDPFAGAAGSLSLGFQSADLGFEPMYAVENNLAAATTFKEQRRLRRRE
jgi:DNA (cytosine-5)-methyltransferase 1